ILGGGQLGKMMTQAAKRMGFTVHILDPTPNSPAAQLADRETVAAFDDARAVAELIRACDVTTYDIEHIAVSALEPLWNDGHHIYPSPRVLGVIQDKLAQRRLFAEAGIPQPTFEPMPSPDPAFMRRFGFPLVQKARHGGYDGKGVKVLMADSEADQAMPVDSYVEPFLDLDKELAVMVARSRDGFIATYPVVEMVFEPKANLLDLLLSPARISPELTRKAQELAVRTVQALACVGVYGVEMFLTKSGELLMNEVAPRPHNSGHYTIEACHTHQFEQHLRAVLGLPLGSTEQMAPAAMVNLLGEPGVTGPAMVVGLREALTVPGARIHIYSKAETRPMRKMGHATVLADDIETAAERARQIKALIRITSQPSQTVEGKHA
ncbi:5-(carboxyamino)imidazole ribonucleotide synthase, partial [candidate division GN15 bacterium]|nr:5-(carboxyamino)imidazole ribonucleotide synthase [candidate division GN15 bacterium]